MGKHKKTTVNDKKRQWKSVDRSNHDIEKAEYKGHRHMTSGDISSDISLEEKVAILKDSFDKNVEFSFSGLNLTVNRNGRMYKFIQEVEEPDIVKAWVALCYIKWHRPWSPFYRQCHEMLAHYPELRSLMVEAMFNYNYLFLK